MNMIDEILAVLIVLAVPVVIWNYWIQWQLRKLMNRVQAVLDRAGG